MQNGESALHAACLFGHLPVAKALLGAGASPRLLNKGKETPIELAEQMGYEGIAAFLRTAQPLVSRV